jgi:uncharacterized protein (DUF362 family)
VPSVEVSNRPPEDLVVIARSARPDYRALDAPVPAPELPGGEARAVALHAVRELFLAWGLDRANAGSPPWNPLGDLIAPGSTVLLKPNWVRHRNRSGAGLDCLVTHTEVIAAVLEYVALARPGRVVLGDAPVQGCDFDALRSACGLDGLVARFRSRGLDLTLRDFRRTVLDRARRTEDLQPLDDYVLFDVGQHSLLEGLPSQAGFRVTKYHPGLLERTHSPGRHQYLVARDAIDASVVINLPKLKSHKKACITGALKNLVGINGNKEYLPHHRAGGAAEGGDCYEGKSWWKRRAEHWLDRSNRRSSRLGQAVPAAVADLCLRAAVHSGSDGNIEGSWWGNDTVWRMVLDLQRILRYGRPDGSFASTPQRKVLTIADAIVAGEGEGPMAPDPVPAGFLTGAMNPAAAEWVHAGLMGFDPRKIPLVREAFSRFDYPLVRFGPGRIQVRLDGRDLPADAVGPLDGRAFRPPRGWAGHCARAAAAPAGVAG